MLTLYPDWPVLWRFLIGSLCCVLPRSDRALVATRSGPRSRDRIIHKFMRNMRDISGVVFLAGTTACLDERTSTW